MEANFRIIQKHFYPLADSLNINTDGLYATLVAGWDIDQYCKNMGYQKKHVLAPIEKIRSYLELAR